MRQVGLLAFSLIIGIGCCAQTATASQFKLPEEIGRVEGPRDLNIFQVEPSVIHERFYTSGQCERRQYVGNVLPDGAEIPDSDPAPKKAGTPQASTGATVVPSGQGQKVTPNKVPAAVSPAKK